MSLPTQPHEWIDYLSRRHDAEKPELELLDRYYEGTQPLSYMHPEIQREIADRIRPVVIGWPQLVVDALEERLDVEGFRIPGAELADQEMWRVWQANNLDEQSQLAHVDALVMRRSYITVGTNEDDADTPLVTVDSPLEVYADIDPRTRRVRAALRRVVEEDTIARLNERYATLYLPDATVWYRWNGAWVEQDRDEHRLGEVPVVPLVNRARLHRARRTNQGMLVRHGTSELAPILPLSDAANKIATDMMLAAEFVAIPLRGFWGIGPDDLVDQDGNRLTALQAIMGRLLTIPESEGKQFEFTAASLSNFHDSLNQLARLVASLSGLPPHYLGFTTDNPASADAIRAEESRLIKRAERKWRPFGGSWEHTQRLVRRFQAGEWDPQLRQLETIWRDAGTPTVGQKADAAVKLYKERISTLPQTRRDIGYTATEITRMEREDAEQARRDPLATIARGLAAGAPADPTAT